jgi:uncharacterized membrane protein YcjF (UPF0283 family)
MYATDARDVGADDVHHQGGVMTTFSTVRSIVGRPTVPLLGVLALVVAGCAQVGGPTLTFWDVIFSMVAFFFWFMLIWIFIGLFADIFRRNDLSGWGKAGWTLLIFILPFIGVLIYMIARPKMTEQDRQIMGRAQERERRASGYSAAEEVAKLAKLRDDGEITAEEYTTLKARALSDA